MKKYYILIFLWLAGFNYSYTQASNLTDNKPLSSDVVVNNSNSNSIVKLNFLDHVENATGVTFGSQIITALIADHILSKKIKGHVKLRLKFYSLSQFFKYKIKAVNLTLTNASIKGVKFKSVKFISTKPLLGKLVDKQNLVFDEPLQGYFTVKINQADLAQTLNNAKVLDRLKAFSLKLPDFGSVKLSLINPKVKFSNDKIIIAAKLVGSDGNVDNGADINISGKLALDSPSFIVLKELQVTSPDITDSTDFSSTISDLINPVVNLYRLRKNGYAIELRDIITENNEILVKGKAGIKLKAIKLPKHI